jgi:hypothetical protein
MLSSRIVHEMPDLSPQTLNIRIGRLQRLVG